MILEIGHLFDKNSFFQQSGNMKTTIDLPDQLMTEVELLAIREQRKVGELVRVGIERRIRPNDQTQQQASANEWLVEWLRLGKETLRNAPSSPTSTEVLDADRNLLHCGLRTASEMTSHHQGTR